ncbi:MAG: hypothetical protein FWE51_00470 [Coriobacteriia bacterium]|nr:hypothetical protein [Coriobacteriia bacterium]
MKIRKITAHMRDDNGQASTEYLIAASVLLVIIVLLAGAANYFGGADSRPRAQAIKRAPYTPLTSEGSGLQWTRDLLVH